MKLSLATAFSLALAALATSAIGQSVREPTAPPSPASDAVSGPASPASPMPPAAMPAPAPNAAREPQAHIPPPPRGKSEVVFFRTGAYAGAGIWYKIREDGAELGKLTNQSYFVVVLDPGPHTFTASTENKTSLKLELDENELYYVRGTVHMGILMGEPNLSPADQALFDLHFDHMHQVKPQSGDAADEPAKPSS